MINRVSLSTPLAAVLWLIGVVPLVWWAVVVHTPAAYGFATASALLWMTGLRALALWLRASAPVARPHQGGGPAPWRLALLSCVADDFEPRALAVSMQQDVAITTVILDDSREEASRRQIDTFAATHGCRVLRRTDRTGYKAGNLNHAVAALRGRFDAYLVCDSDLVLPPDLARRCAEALSDPTVAVAQARPEAPTGRTRFARYFGPLLATHLGVSRRGRAGHGVAAFLGRGALVRATAIDDVGGFPAAVAEDLAMTVSLRRRGWRIVDVEATFTEDYPVDYRAFRTQMRKTAEGAVEFLRQVPRRHGWLSGMPMRERIDIAVETALVPLAALAGAVALVCGAGLAATGNVPPVWVLAVSAIGALAPLLPEVVRRGRTHRPAAGLAFAAIAGALYASTVFVVLAAVMGTLAGRRAVFWVTPKSATRLGARQWFAMLRPEALLAPVLIAATVLASGSPWAAGALAGPMLAAAMFSVPVLRGRRVSVATPSLAPGRSVAAVGVGARA